MKTKKFIRFIEYLIGIGIIGIFIFSVSTSSAIIHSQTGEIELTYKNFTYQSDDLCTFDDNWCNRVSLPNKAIIYGSIETEIKVPKETRDVDVWIHIPCNSLGEGLYGRGGSVAVIYVDNESKPETIKSSDNHHHGFYYKYDYCESFLNSFNVYGDKIILKIEMIADARLDLEKVVLRFYDGENESKNESKIMIENESINISIQIDSDNDSIPNVDDSCPEIKGPTCNNGCPIETDIDVDGFQEDNSDCSNYDKYPYDQDNDGITTVKDCDDYDYKNTKTKGDYDNDGVSNCIDKCLYEKGDDKYGCPKIKKKETPKQSPKESINWSMAILALIFIIILILIIIFLIRK